MVHLTGAGSCTITAEQAGSDAYEAADPVSQSFAIAKARATLTVGTEFVYDGSPKQARITTDPVGLTGVTVTYRLNGAPIESPTNVGTYQVQARLEHPDYEADAASGTLVITPAAPVIHWATPAPIHVSTVLGDAQLNARAAGVDGAALIGDFIYNPLAGTRLRAGTHVLSVEFRPVDGNYTNAVKSVELSVVYRFKGFQRPVKNPPALNSVQAGATVPLKFSLDRNEGLGVLQGSPTSTAIACRAGASETISTDNDDDEDRSGLRSEGSTYTYFWKTDRSWSGTCRKLVLTLADGTKHEAEFRFLSKSKSQAGTRSSERRQTRRQGDR